MADYAAVVSLINRLNSSIELVGRFSSECSAFLQDFKQSVCLLEAFLRDHPPLNKNDRKQIQVLAQKTENLIDSPTSDIYLGYRSRVYKMKKKFDRLTETKWQYECSTMCTSVFTAGHSLCSSTSRNTMPSETNLVGCDDDLIKIKEQLVGITYSLSIFSIVGMGGIGKTALTRAVYDDSYIEHYFYIRSWIAVSQGYEVRKMLLGILSSVSNSADELYRESNEQLAEQLYRRLKGRRYLIVLDDIWDIEAWNVIKRSFPDDNNGSRIIFTSRHTNIASHVNTRSLTHDMHLLNMDQSIKLLSLKVLGTESFPLELENVGIQIAGKCQGLPLAIIVVAGILVKMNKTAESWEDVAKSVGSFQNNGSSEEWLDVLSLSYNYLPQHLKPCFLYIGAFPKNDEISVPRIIRLLVAEGFLLVFEGKTMEEVAEEYLEDLISRSLLMATKRGYDGRVIKCNMHDLLRDISIRESERENFLHVNVSPGVPYSVSRRFFCQDIDPDDDKYLPESASIHSFLGFGRVRTLINFSLMLRVLDLSFQPFNRFPVQILYSKFLRYLAIASFSELPPSLSQLCHLQTLVRHCHEERLVLPVSIWEMKQLRHLHFKKSCSLLFPEARGLQEIQLYLPNLQTLSNLSFGSCFEEILTRLPNLKKLGLREEEGERLSDEKLLYHLNNLKFLPSLETLKCFFTKQRPLPMPDAFPLNLKQLTLRGCRRSWKEMLILSALPKLEVLKLKDCAFIGSEWELMEEQVFCQLKAMVIDIADLEQWEACSSHFPNLQFLVLKYCKHLKEIPIGIGDINTLQLIELWACSSSANDSAERIQEEQQNSGNDGLTIKIHRIPNDEWHTNRLCSSSAENSEGEI
ncbi:PREDICTED: putative late blight resistance protein homolog R1B-16 isoform X2 [Ipomoea nil]|uniref:putative late blight resistance protein homolog R1B-16 isoform X2 n=1 Tax=Ipomoea nil TaxID=35883 RepID=UPI000901FCC7|nr:PREDICTED: putative late blight resistance protein homolog R1B-16 isoform X2 [Ipomoea nil]